MARERRSSYVTAEGDGVKVVRRPRPHSTRHTSALAAERSAPAASSSPSTPCARPCRASAPTTRRASTTCRRCLTSCASLTSMPPYFAFQAEIVCLETPYPRPTSYMLRPASTCFRPQSSLRVPARSHAGPLLRPKSYLVLDGFRGSGQHQQQALPEVTRDPWKSTYKRRGNRAERLVLLVARLGTSLRSVLYAGETA